MIKYVAAVVIGFLAGVLFMYGSPPKLGISTNDPAYTTPTNAAILCKNGVSTAVVSAESGRTSFEAWNVASSSVYLCKAATCTATTGAYLANTSTLGAAFYKQTDGYIGAYSCIGITSTGTLNISHSE